MRKLALLAAACLMLTGCASQIQPVGPPADDGLGVPLPQPIEPGIGGEVAPTLLTSRLAEPGEGTVVEGVLGVNIFDCVTVDDRLLVAPIGSTVEGNAIALAGYGSFAIGDSISLAGATSDDVVLADLADEFSFCTPGDDTTVDLAYLTSKGR